MILYNTIVGLAAGVALILVAKLLKKLANGEKLQPEGFSLSFAMTGFILIVLGITISVMWPCNKVLDANIMFGEPALAERGKKKAVVAVARKLGILLHRLWVTGEVYEPLRNQNLRQERKKR